MSDSAQPPTSNLPAYFNKLSITYPKSTGRSTERLFETLLTKLAPIGPDSVIHDNASGPATATSVLLSKPEIAKALPRIICTDMVEAMIEGANDLLREHNWRGVETKVMKSDVPMDFPDAYFSHSITNFSIFNFSDRVQATSEIHRTLRPGGQVVMSTWKVFRVGELMRVAQRRIRADAKPIAFSGEEMYDGNAVLNVLVQGGFEQGKLEIVQGEYMVAGEDLEGVKMFMKGPLLQSARDGFTEEEQARWSATIDEVVEEQKQAAGGILAEMIAVIGTK